MKKGLKKRVTIIGLGNSVVISRIHKDYQQFESFIKEMDSLGVDRQDSKDYLIHATTKYGFSNREGMDFCLETHRKKQASK